MELMDDRLSIGSVIFEFVYNTHPPKEKYYIIVGQSEDKIALATVFINTSINQYFRSKPDLLKLHLPLHAADYPFLKWDSHVDCTDIQERRTEDVAKCINSATGRNGYCATISDTELNNILIALDASRLMSPIKKKKFGIRK